MLSTAPCICTEINRILSLKHQFFTKFKQIDVFQYQGVMLVNLQLLDVFVLIDNTLPTTKRKAYNNSKNKLTE